MIVIGRLGNGSSALTGTTATPTRAIAAQRRRLDRAALHRERTARMEAAARRRRQRARHLAGQRGRVPWLVEVDRHGRREQRARVRMLRAEGHRVGVPELHGAAEVHDGDAVAHVRDGTEIVRDEEIGHAEALLQIREQIENLRADRDVQRGDGLVQHDQLGRQRQRAGDGDALALAARELVRVQAGRSLRQTDDVEQLGYATPARDAVQVAVDHQRLGHDGRDPHAGIERSVGILEDGLHEPPVVALAGAPEGMDVAALETDGPPGGPLETQDELRRGGLPAARLTHQAEGGAGLDREGDRVHGAHEAGRPPERAPAHGEVLGELLRLEERCAVAREVVNRRGHGASSASCGRRQPPSRAGLPRDSGPSHRDSAARMRIPRGAARGPGAARRWR